MNKITLLDGAMGTMIQAAGLPLGARPELFTMEHEEVLASIHQQYIDAGSEVIYANTFGANAHKLKGLGVSVRSVLEKNIAIAKSVAKNQIKVALDIGPIGELMEPFGTLSFDQAYEIYKEMVCIGKECGVDLVVFETMTDLLEVKAGVLACKENTDLPVWVTMSFEKDGRTFTGCTVSCMATVLDGLQVDAMGINCSLGPREIFPLMKEMAQWTDKALIVKPNAGLPDPASGRYNMTYEDFGFEMQIFKEIGVEIMGGCCGTTPSFIAELAKNKDCPNVKREKKKVGVCSSNQMCELNGVRTIGERINPTGKKRFQQALKDHDLNYIMERAIEQSDAGADILDVNVGLPGIDEPKMMVDVVKAIQSVVTLPLQIDSSNPEAIEAGLRICNGKAIVNSINGEEEKMNEILPIVKKYGASVLGLTMDKEGIPQSASKRYEIAQRIYKKALSYGIAKEDIYIDCLTLTVSAQQEQAKETLKAIELVKQNLGLHCVLGVSNISFGLPQRIHITTNFLIQAMYCGLDLPIVNPNTKEIMDAIYSFKVLSGEDESCTNYIERFTLQDEKQVASPTSKYTIETAVLKGLKEETARLTEQALETMSELDVINEKLIPALDVVGDQYEKQKLFLPQLINAANAACAGFDLIKERIAQKGEGSLSKGKILIATVEGDIHDIGKNIVRVVLENYGYQVIDLGRDVPVQKVVDEAIANDVHLIGLSALMTTTVESMARTIKALRNSGHECTIFVGGAVLTEEYAMEIGADYYTKDAKASADVARKVLG